MTINELKQDFWSAHRSVKSRSNRKRKIEAEQFRSRTAEAIINNYSDDEIDGTFGKFADFVRKCADWEMIKSSTGAYLFVKINASGSVS